MWQVLNSLDLTAGEPLLEIGALDAGFTQDLIAFSQKAKMPLTLLCQSPPSPAASSLNVVPVNDAYLMDFPDKKFAGIFIHHLLETVRMDQLYMILSESRRIIKPSGFLAISSATTSKSFWKNFWLKKIQKKKLLELHHYFSPEDWHEMHYSCSHTSFQPIEFLLLRKLAD